jgi:hypothetical protein
VRVCPVQAIDVQVAEYYSRGFPVLPPIVHSQAHPGFTELASGERVMAG